MNALEGRLRDAYQAAAQTVRPESIPDLPAPPDQARTNRRRWPRIAVPLTAAAAAALVAVTAWAIGQQASQPPGRAAFTLGPAAARPMPAFLVTLPGTGPGMMVYRAATGQLLTRIAPPRGLSFEAVTATSDNRSFVVAAAPTHGRCTTRFYQLRLGSQGRTARLSALAVPEATTNSVVSMSASANGRTVAYSADNCTGSGGQLSVARVGHTAIRSWPVRSALSLSLTADGRLLYFDNSTVTGGDGTVRVIPTNAPHGQLLRHARIVLPADSGIDETGSTTLVPGGRVMLGCLIRGQTVILAAYNTATGAQLGIIRTWPHAEAQPCEVTAAPGGGYAFVWISLPGLGSRVDLATGRARREPGDPNADPPDGIAW